MASPEKYKHIDFTPPAGVRKEAEYGLRLRREHGRGGTAVGIARARDLANGARLSPSTIRRMKAFFDRHASDSKAEGFRKGEKGWPSNGVIANKLWGGPSGYSWAKKVVSQMDAADARSYCPDTETRSIEVKETAMHNVERRYLASTGAENATEGGLSVEHRADPQTGEKRTYLIGYAAKFNTDSLLLGDFVERLAPSAFEIVEKGEDLEGKPLETRGLFNHDPNHLLGRFPTTMKLVVDKVGLKYEILLPESRKDIEESVARGDLKGSSFSFVVAEGGEKWTREGGKSRRLVTKIKSLLDCGPVTYPAYRDSSVAVAKRSYEQFVAAASPEKPKVDFKEEMRKLREFYSERRGFCPTGPGGGVDNSCGKGEGGGDKSEKTSGGRVSSAIKGAIAGAAAGAIGGLPGAVVGAVALGFAAYVASGKKTDEALESAKKSMGIEDTKLNVAAASLFGKGKPQRIETKVTQDGVIEMSAREGQAFISGKPPVFIREKGVKGESNLHFNPNGGGENVARDAELAAKAVGVGTVTVQSWDPDTDKGLKDAGFKKTNSGFSKSENHDVWVKRLSSTSKSKRYEELMEFYAERRGFCPTGEGGGVDNSCGPSGGGNGKGGGSDDEKSGDGAGPIVPKPTVGDKYGKPSKGLDVEKVKKGGYKDGPLTGWKPSGRVPLSVQAMKDLGDIVSKKSGESMEWSKGKDHKISGKEKQAQDFLDRAREGQMARGGKDKGQADEGGGVQTWSKGDHFPWTTKQVGDNDGYLQGVHPDGSKTEKYPFTGGKTSEAEKKLGEELKAKIKSSTKKRADQVVEDTLRFLKGRR